MYRALRLICSYFQEGGALLEGIISFAFSRTIDRSAEASRSRRSCDAMCTNERGILCRGAARTDTQNVHDTRYLRDSCAGEVLRLYPTRERVTLVGLWC